MSDDSNRPATRPSRDALPSGTRFGEFEILRVLGVGGFGVVYLANDYSLERQVALKEYMPASLAVRGEGIRITIRSEAYAETYAMGLRSFINEARLLAKFDHPSLVKVYRFWEDNATAYMVMPYLQGITLRDKRKAMALPPDETWIRSVLDPMLDALEQLHGEGVYHRDVAPDNILLPPSGAPILLDFGSARRVISDRTQSLTAILKPSYAPIEQYAEMASMRQGAWTDIYALGAVMHYLLFGVPPEPSTARAVQDDAEQIEHREVPGVSPRFMSVVAWMLGVRPLERPQSVAVVRAALRGEVAVPVRPRRDDAAAGNTAPLPVATREGTQADTDFQPTLLAEGSYASTRLDTDHLPTVLLTQPAAPATFTADAAAAAPARTGGGRTWLFVGVAVLMIAAALAAWQFAGVDHPQAPGPAVPVVPAQAPPAVDVPDTGPTPANAAIALALSTTDNRTHFKRGEPFSLLVRPSRDAHVYCYLRDETARVMRFYPNRFAKDSLVMASEPLTLPGPMRFQLLMNSKGVQETIACFATQRDVAKDLPVGVLGVDFEATSLTLEQIRSAFGDASGGTVAQQSIQIQPE